MTLVAGMRHAVDALIGSDAVERIGRSGWFDADQIELIHSTFFGPGQCGAPGGPWEPLRHAHLRLPDWFQPGLDPLSEAYADQQRRLWRLVAGVERDYDVERDEKEADIGEVDPVRFPGYYVRRDPGAVEAASDHVIATGMLLKHCGLRPGDWALEYGAGFGQTALALARLGVHVDTVDVSAAFCEYVRRQGEFFGVPLTAFKGRFGDAPRPEQRYQLVWFYESFHHCLDFVRVVRQLPRLLAPGGKVILSGEPIAERAYAAVPYPWGLRMHSEVVAVVRRQRWFELGFTEDFLFELFAHAGFTVNRVDCPPSLFGRMYVCEYRPNRIMPLTQWLPPELADAWAEPHGEGRWTRESSRWPIERREVERMIELELENPLPIARSVELDAGGEPLRIELRPHARMRVGTGAAAGATHLTVRSLVDPSGPWWRRRTLHRPGVVVHSIRADDSITS
jgi:SAM-dependent methyltransferase